jgi:hypothetical protein
MRIHLVTNRVRCLREGEGSDCSLVCFDFCTILLDVRVVRFNDMDGSALEVALLSTSLLYLGYRNSNRKLTLLSSCVVVIF